MLKIKEGFNLKVKIKTDGYKATQILLDNKDISHRVVGTYVNLKGGCIPTVTLELRPEDIEIEGEFECLREKTNKEYTFEELANKISEKLVEKVFRRN